MATSKSITWLISDIINWEKNKELIVNDSFQRHSVWTPQAKTLLIDTILNELPIPKIFIRTKIDGKKQTAIKEIVDGQQRIRSIVEFAKGDFVLNNKSENFHNLTYNDLTEEQQENFLGYSITAEQLLNATDDDVIDIFARLNSYTVSLNSAEKRHAAFQTELKFFVRKLSVTYRWFIEKYQIFTLRQRFRMADDEFFAEIVRLICDGVSDGGSPKIDSFYKKMKDDVFETKMQDIIEKKINALISFFDDVIGDFFKGPLGKHYQLYAIAAAFFIINGDISFEGKKSVRKFLNIDAIRNNFVNLELELENDKTISKFKKASSSSTHRISSRKVRTEIFIKNLS